MLTLLRTSYIITLAFERNAKKSIKIVVKKDFRGVAQLG